jgi:putative ABC transport system permease protein
MLKSFSRRWQTLFRRESTERELDDEIRLHLEMETEKNIRSGMSAEVARREALLAFGGIDGVKEAHRDGRGLRWLEDTVNDTRFALRMFRRNPLLAATAILTLALGIGANTAIFSVVNRVILRPLPFPSPDQLMMLAEDNPEKNWHQQVAAPANYLDWRERVPAFADVAAYDERPSRQTLSVGQEPVLVSRANVTGNFFSVLGVPAAYGRVLREEETWAPGANVAVISYGFWERQFAGDRTVIGRIVHLNGVANEIVGVMPRGFTFPSPDADLWTPMGWSRDGLSQIHFRRAHWIRVVARLKPGISQQQADAQFQGVVRQLQVEYPETNRVMGADMMPLHDFLVGKVRQPLWVLLGSVLLLLLIACANVGNLLLVQALGREREAALRLALGAGRGRLIRQALTESLVLSALGGLAGLVLGWLGTGALVALQPAGMLPVRDVSLDWGVVAYVVAVTTLSGLLFGIAPAIWRGRRAPAEILKEGGRLASEGSRIRRWANALVVAEIALALLLTTGAGLLVRSFWRLQQVDPGFDPKGVLAVAINLPPVKYDTSTKIVSFFDELQDRAHGLPGVTEAATVVTPALAGTGWTSDFHIAGRPADEYGTEVVHRTAAPDYFRVMRIPLRSGRVFTAEDREGSPQVVLINEALARQYFKGEDPVGQRISFDRTPDSTSVSYTIVGVVGSERQASLAIKPRIEVFTPFAQSPNEYMTLMLRTSVPPATLSASVRQLVKEIDPDLAIVSIDPMEELWSRSLASQRFFMTLLLAFASVGLALAIVGVYGVMAQVARRRTREMGIRIALGARATHVQWLIVRHGLRLVLVGLTLGTAGALGATRAMRALLYEVAPSDPLTFLTVPLLLVIAALGASWLPAARASHADPAHTLRTD